MSSESFAALRRHRTEELAKLAQEHYQHDLNESDREALQSAATRFSTYATIGSVIGLGLGCLLAFRARSARTRTFRALKAAERPTHITFEGGRTEPIPDLRPMLAPTALGDFAAYTLFGLGGMFVFGELGGLTGAWSARRSILNRDQESRNRIERAFRGFRADVLRKEAEQLEKGGRDSVLGL